MNPIVGGLVTSVLEIINKVIPDPAAKAQAQLQVLQMQQNGQLKEMELNLSAIIAEAQSSDPWTSRARPSFLYVMYAMILCSIPMGLISAFDADIADRIIKGMTGYLNALPEALYALFGTGYLGYTAARQWGKSKGSDK
jgi:hypothetical protein